MKSPVKLHGRICQQCGWKQAERYFHKIVESIRYGCYRCGSSETTLGTFDVTDSDVVFNNPIYDKHVNRWYIQIGASKYFIVFEREATQIGRNIDAESTVHNAALIYMVSGTSSDLSVLDVGWGSEPLFQVLLRVSHILPPIISRHRELKEELNKSSMIRSIRGILHDGATVIRG